MNWLAVSTALAFVPALCRGVPYTPLFRRQDDASMCNDTGQGPFGQYINQTYYNGHEGPVTVSVQVNGGQRNQTAPMLYGW